MGCNQWTKWIRLEISSFHHFSLLYFACLPLYLSHFCWLKHLICSSIIAHMLLFPIYYTFWCCMYCYYLHDVVPMFGAFRKNQTRSYHSSVASSGQPYRVPNHFRWKVERKYLKSRCQILITTGRRPNIAMCENRHNYLELYLSFSKCMKRVRAQRRAISPMIQAPYLVCSFSFYFSPNISLSYLPARFFLVRRSRCRFQR